jgi:CheY-like chemotaxis protein
MTNENSPSVKKTILIVDDVESNVILLELFLKKYGYEVRRASNGLSAIESLIIKEPDLILMDLQMPYIDGYEATHTIRSRRTSKYIPIIAVSALINEYNKDNLDSLGFDAYAMKPIDLSPTGLIASIRKLLGQT